jgi:ABC-2 type transport system ATP-binding protein
MSLEINHLSKVYGSQKAVNDISFSVAKGEIVGFLGPNGAGKSTTMKIATGYLSPTSGSVKIGGYDVTIKAREVKQITGYLPEHNPLYLDLFVHEYLLFIGRLYGLRGASLVKRVEEMIELCGLTREQGKKIEELSKGYRQRVGLAQALIHNPEVLILDEPTSGLDPNQILEIRKLIKDISQDKTVLFSTHIMQEVQALCNRVVVINRGEIVANDFLVNVMQRPEGIAIIVEFEREIETQSLQAIPGIKQVQHLGNLSYRLLAEPGVDLRPEIFRYAANHNLSLVGLRQEESSLENIFRDLTSTTAE